MYLNLVIRLKLTNKPGTLARVLTVIAQEGGTIGAIDLIAASPSCVTRDLMIRLDSRDHLDRLVNVFEQMPEINILRISDRVFISHQGGKIEISPKRPILNWEDLSLMYTPGVAGVSEAIAEETDMAYGLTMKGNSVAIVTDGSAVLGLGDLGPYAALPVMEGKAVLFKKFAGIDAFPLCLNVHEPEEIIEVVAACAPAFGGINLEDIAAPKCFEIEEKLAARLDIPVFHDDQHGTAIVTLAGLINALKVAGKNIAEVKVVISGAGAAGVAIAKILMRAGARNLVVCDRKGAIARDVPPRQPSKLWIAENTNKRCLHGPLKEVIAGADVFIGVSAPSLLNREDIMKMAEKAIVFALANPEPEVEPKEIYDVASVIATGRSDYPNQINNALAFPGVFRGALDCHARVVNDEMCLAAAHALAGMVSEEELSVENIIPSVFNDQVAPVLAKAVKQAAKQTGVARDFHVRPITAVK
ncbi:NAD-dependent malic enzyme [Pelotomaculum propionicicum]|uniref:NAD-dependent malic enzyme n=1 Tax=Pelotomaculum propionicicum TaxID=258475 RepID=A0A4Y7RW53_9FIRM|nr:NAD-dependent malic enzyme [Pelotomaculum propionicicum]TEB13215.1 NAD-dependent malic enzyme [Pelotomaculum propionicicum]